LSFPHLKSLSNVHIREAFFFLKPDSAVTDDLTFQNLDGKKVTVASPVSRVRATHESTLKEIEEKTIVVAK